MSTTHDQTSIQLKSGVTIPLLGLGTWLSKPGEVGNAVDIAIRSAGYRHIDCAQAYQNQSEIGVVFNRLIHDEHIIKREDLFVTSKIWNTFHSFDRATKAVDDILHDLQLSYLDLCLIHWPMGFEEGGELFPKNPDGKMRFSDVDYMDTWRALEKAVSDGKVRAIGLSNFNSKQIQRVIDNCKIHPDVLQIELHPYFQQRELVEFAQRNGLIVTAYSPLGNPSNPFRKPGEANVLEDVVICDIAKRHEQTPAQIVLRWAIQRQIVVIPKSISEKRLKENANIFGFELSNDEMKLIQNIDKHWRILDLTPRDGNHMHFPFNEPF